MKDVEYYVKNKEIRVLVKYYFNFNLTPKQEEIVRLIAYAEYPRVCINAMTRYGKSRCVAIGVTLYILFNKNKRVAIIAPQEEQASIIRNYIAEHIISSPVLANLVEIDRDNSIERLKRETSRRRWTFKNGCQLLTISAHGEASRLMGFGANLVICDESAKISREAYAKIVRMLGDDPENSILIELANPWDKDNKYFEHYVSGRFKVLHIDYKDAISEGRVTETFIEEMRLELTPLEFTVLYESKFPDEAEDSLFSYKEINRAIENNFDISEGAGIISCDPADKGLDFTVIYYGHEKAGKYKVEYIYSEPKSENMTIANRIIKLFEEKGDVKKINVDCIGIGVGIVSRLKEVLGGKCNINACHFGESPEDINKDLPTSSKKRFINKKAEQYFRLK